VIPSVFVTRNTFVTLLSMVRKGDVRITLDSHGEAQIDPNSPGAGRSSTGNHIINSLIRMVLFLAAGFPSLWMCWLSFFFMGNAFQGCVDRCKRRRRLAHIPAVQYSVEHSHDKTDPEYIINNSCVICLDEFMDGQTVKLLPCKHGFCANCIESWLSDRSDLCPICKRSILADPVTPNAQVHNDAVVVFGGRGCFGNLSRRIAVWSHRRNIRAGGDYARVTQSGHEDGSGNNSVHMNEVHHQHVRGYSDEQL
jgi:hypothetical protein